MSVGLRECPFCKSDEATIDEVNGMMNEIRFSPTCSEELCILYCVPRSYNTPAEAIEAWNTRADDNVKALVDKQAEDEGLWFDAETAPEAYLQLELRKLHAIIEGYG